MAQILLNCVRGEYGSNTPKFVRGVNGSNTPFILGTQFILNMASSDIDLLPIISDRYNF